MLVSWAYAIVSERTTNIAFASSANETLLWVASSPAYRSAKNALFIQGRAGCGHEQASRFVANRTLECHDPFRERTFPLSS